MLIKNHFPVIFFCLAVVITPLIFWFYWFQWRPIQIKKDCYRTAEDSFQSNFDRLSGGDGRVPGDVLRQLHEDFDAKYSKCLHKNGL